ncbi:MAG: hypothetical protein QGG36_19105 [Pirellulaceae bacterium]|nr:hypothetical protein [Pirellulaceae bacterium]MDP7017922.1 hypothetical protein [Pirellulaceae bacterium]
MSNLERRIWRLLQVLAWAAGMFIWGALFIDPRLGLHLLWNVLIPIAPALFVIAPGAWRNVCPLGSMALAPHHIGWSQQKRLSAVWRGRLFFAAFVLLIVVAPFRKVLLDTNGPLIGALLFAVGLVAIGMGLVLSQKSGWCSSLCPVYPVELLYGSQPVVSVPNAHCHTCLRCVSPCSESTVGLTPRTAVETKLGRATGVALTGCFPGFVWGWYNVPMFSGWDGVRHLHIAYGIPYAAASLSLVVYVTLCGVRPKQEDLITGIFATAAISTYYWFRLPPVFGIGDPDAAMIVDMSPWLPTWSATALRVIALGVFGWLMLARTNRRRAWQTQFNSL